MKLIFLVIVAAVAVTADPQFGLNAPARLANTAFGAANIAANTADSVRSTLLKSFGDFQTIHNKVYATPALAARAQEFFLKNFEDIKDHNEKFAQGLFSFKIGVNEFFDGDLLQILTGLCGTIPPDNDDDARRKREAKADPSTFPAGPDTVDFSDSVQPIVHQGSCGGCWSFATIAQLESLYARTAKGAYNISMQYLLDCTAKTKGCNGGWPKYAMDFILESGATTNASYPYKSETETCQTPSTDNTLPKVADKAISYKLKGNEEYLKNILAKEGPIVVVMSATEILMKYSSGVFSDPDCSNNCKKVNHAVLLVGYGTDSETKKPYWLLRNSWGTSWGENGYFKMIRDGSNNCGISCYAMYLQA